MESNELYKARVLDSGTHEQSMRTEFAPFVLNTVNNFFRDAVRITTGEVQARLCRAWLILMNDVKKVLTDGGLGGLFAKHGIPVVADEEQGLPLPEKYRNPCFLKAGDDEPIFVLRAKDSLAPEIVREWVKLARLCGKTPPEKLAEAEELAVKMEKWGEQNECRLPD